MTAKTITVRLAPRFCPVCFKVLDAATNLTSDDPPEPGDFTVCIDCRAVLRWGADMNLELSSLEEIPAHSRMVFAKVLRIMEQLPPVRRKDGKVS